MWQIIVVLFVLALLFAAGLLFVNQSLYKDFEGKDPVVQVRCAYITQYNNQKSRMLNTLCRVRNPQLAEHQVMLTPVILYDSR